MSHGVNVAQALKSATIWWRVNGTDGNVGLVDALYEELASRRIVTMDEYFGMATGIYSADELLIGGTKETRKNPSRGSELCAVVKLMWSYSTLFSAFGDVAFLDRTNRIAYNALPATFVSRRGGDMWNHQYLQANNEITAERQYVHVWHINNNQDLEVYGVAPNIGCCTAKFNQGWPKLAAFSLFFLKYRGVPAVGVFVPASAVLEDGLHIIMDTSYPYSHSVKVTLVPPSGTPWKGLYICIPSWAMHATVTMNGAPQPGHTANGTMHLVLPPSSTSVLLVVELDLNPAVRLEEWYPGFISVHRGNLMYSLPITTTITSTKKYQYPESQYLEDQPASEWRFALDVPGREDDLYLLFVQDHPLGAGEAPFNHSGWPVYIEAPVQEVSSNVWGYVQWENHGSAAPPPGDDPCMGIGGDA